MRIPEPEVEIDVQGIRVGFLRRDIRQISDREMAHVTRMVRDVAQSADPDQRVDRIIILTDYPDPDRNSYVASYRVEVTERLPDAAERLPDAAEEDSDG